MWCVFVRSFGRFPACQFHASSAGENWLPANGNDYSNTRRNSGSNRAPSYTSTHCSLVRVDEQHDGQEGSLIEESGSKEISWWWYDHRPGIG